MKVDRKLLFMILSNAVSWELLVFQYNLSVAAATLSTNLFFRPEFKVLVLFYKALKSLDPSSLKDRTTL